MLNLKIHCDRYQVVWGWVLCGVVLWAVSPARADELVTDESVTAEPVSQEPVTKNTYAEMDLEQLMSIQVDSVAGVNQGWLSTPAAVYVLNGEDIARSGHQFLPELFRDVPGMHVGWTNAHEAAVSARGFNANLANKLLVLVDGCDIYDAAFGGAFWQSEELMLDNIDQIEIIRGPGATLWGANAVNGVVNVETKNARDTQGLYVKQVTGTELRDLTAVRYGGKIDDDTYYRVWGKYVNQDAGKPISGLGRVDDWSATWAGFRIDHTGPDHTDLMLQGHLDYTDSIGEGLITPSAIPFVPNRRVYHNQRYNARLSARLEQNRPNGEGWSAQGFVNSWRFLLADFNFQAANANFDWRYRWNPDPAHKLIAGVGCRVEYYDVSPAATFSFTPLGGPYGNDGVMHIVSGFLQDTITLKPDRWFMMLGSKFEHNTFSGFEVQPSARLWWTPDDHQTVWAAVSRAVRRPSLFDEQLYVGLLSTGFPPPNDTVEIYGSNVDAEELLAYELGYRQQVNPDLTVDLSAFYNQYTNLVAPRAVVEDLILTNGAAANTYGLEAAVRWKPADNLRLTGSYSALKIDARGLNAATIEDNDPVHQFKLRSDYNLTDALSLHGAVYYVGDAGDIAPYWRMDAGVTWQINSQVDLSVWGQNLLDPSHGEFAAAPAFTATETQRNVYVQLRCRF